MTSDREQQEQEESVDQSAESTSSRRKRPSLSGLKRSRWARLVGGGALGAGIASALQVSVNFAGIPRVAVAGGFIGFAVAAVYDRNYKDVQLSEVQISLPQFSNFTFMVNAEYRRVSWQLFIEVCTRIATQPLGPEEGFLREALDSLHNLFGTTRELLKGMDPSPSYMVEGSDATVEMLAVSMLNQELRPFLSKWHPLLSEFENRPDGRDERQWERNQEFRDELSKLRESMGEYARGFGELAGVSNLDYFVHSTDSPSE